MNMNKSNIPILKSTPKVISSKPQPIGDFLLRKGPPGPGQQGRGHELISSYPNRGSPHVLAAAGTVFSSSIRNRSFIPVPERVVGALASPSGSISSTGSAASIKNNDDNKQSTGSLLSRNPRRFLSKDDERPSGVLIGRSKTSSHVTSTPRSGRDQFQLQKQQQPSARSLISDVRSRSVTMTRSSNRNPQGGATPGDNLMAHHTSSRPETTSERQHRLTSKVVMRKKSNTYPDLKRNQSQSRPKTATDKQNEWKMKYGRLAGVESARVVGKVKPCSLVSLSQVVTSVISKPLEETKKSMLHLEALKNTLAKSSTRESLLAPFLPRQDPVPILNKRLPAYTSKKSEPSSASSSPRLVGSLRKVKEIEPRRIAYRREMNPPPQTAPPVPLPRLPSLITRSQKKRSFEKKLKEKGIVEEQASRELRSKSGRREFENAIKREERRSKSPSGDEQQEPNTVTPNRVLSESKDNNKTSTPVAVDNLVDKSKSTKANGNSNSNKEVQTEIKENKPPLQETSDGHYSSKSNSASASDEGHHQCKRCRKLESREQRRINDLVTENKSLTFMLGQKRSLVHSLQNQVKGLLNDNQKMAVRLMMSRKKTEKLEKQVLRRLHKTPSEEKEPPPPPPVTPVAPILMPSTPAELEAKLIQLTQDLRALQVASEKNSLFLSSLLYTLGSLGYESLTDPSGNEIDLSRCCEGITLELKGRDPKLPRISSSGGSGGGGDSYHKPRKLASGQELMLKAVIGSQEEFIKRMSVQFQDLHRSNFIRGVLREEEEVADTVLDLLECSVRFCPSVMSAFEERLTVSPPRSSLAMKKILERLSTIRETKFTPTVAAVGLSSGEKEKTPGGHGRKDRMMMKRSGASASGLDNQPSEEKGRSRKCLEDDDDEDEVDENEEEDVPEWKKDMMTWSGDGDELPEETKDFP